MNRHTQDDLNQLVDHYTAIWNKADAEHCYKSISELWVADGIQFTRSREIHGHQALFERIATHYETFVISLIEEV